jgi:hypothetical protein
LWSSAGASSKVRIGPAIINIDAVMEKNTSFAEIVHVKSCGILEDIFEGEKLAPYSLT